MSNPREKLHGKVISYKDIDSLIPNRDKFLDEALHKKVQSIKNSGANLLFMPNSTYDDKPMQDGQYQKSKYKLVLFGVLEDGSRASVCINDIDPYFEIKIPDKQKKKDEYAENLYYELNMEGPNDFDKVQRVLQQNGKYPEYGFKLEPIRYEIVKGKPLHGFQEHDSYYIRIYFNKLAHRKTAIQYMRALGHQTAHDDLNSYYRVVSRDYSLAIANWMQISDYSIEENDYIKGDVINVSIGDICTYTGALENHLEKDLTMTMAFDIETYNANKDGEIPLPQFPNHNMFMISMTFQWYHAPNQLLSVCLVDVPSAPHPDFLTIVCKSEKNLIRVFAQIYSKMQAEFIMGFNDSNYDWKWIVERAIFHGIVNDFVDAFDFVKIKDRTEKQSLYQYKSFEVKIEADVNAKGQNLQTNGYLPFDVMILFRQLYPTSEKYSLNFFLSKNKLGGKEDMPYQEMFAIYESVSQLVKAGSQIPTELLEKMALVAKYCVVDSIRCHDLTNIRNVIRERREVANISYTSMYDALYRANGMKVRNLVINRGNVRSLKISNIANTQIEDGKYPGAFVFPPKKGLSISKLDIRERIKKAELGYPEYSGWLNTDEETVSEYIKIIDEVGATPSPDVVDKLDIPPHFRKMLLEPIGRPITGLDYSSLYPSLMMTYNLSPEYMITDLAYAREVFKKKEHELYKIKFEFNGRWIRGWSVRHDNKLDTTKSDCKFGLFPSILKDLFDMRSQLKKKPDGLNALEHEIEKFKLISKEDFTEELREKYNDTVFKFNVLDSKQKAVKVFMNTFYGESGNKRSPLFMLQVAGGITSAGQDNIKKAFRYVEDKECKVYYGDSVLADTPILIRYTEGPMAGMIDIRTIDDIPFEPIKHSAEEKESESEYSDQWYGYPQFKPHEVEPIRIDKQMHKPIKGLETWTHKGWQPIKKVIRHKTDKQIIRVNTHSGCIDVTEDHSLMTSKLAALSPKDAKIGDELCHGFPAEFPNKEYILNERNEMKLFCKYCNSMKYISSFHKGGQNASRFFRKHECALCRRMKGDGRRKDDDGKFLNNVTDNILNMSEDIERPITEDEAWLMGCFFGDGNAFCSYRSNKWIIAKCNIVLITKCKLIMEKMENKFDFQITRDDNDLYTKPMFIVEPKNGLTKNLATKYRELFYDSRKYKKVPSQILNAPLNIRKWFMKGYMDTDGNKSEYMTLENRGKIGSQGLYYLLKSLGFNPTIYVRDKRQDLYVIKCNKHYIKKPMHEIKKILNLTEFNKDYIRFTEKNSVQLSVLDIQNLENKTKKQTDDIDILINDLELFNVQENISEKNHKSISELRKSEYVYDIETKAGTFHGGVGNLIISNTDSIYLSMPEKVFEEVDRNYYTEKISKEDYWNKLVDLTFKTIKPLNVGVNEMLEADNGTTFLRMAYEEALYPVVFLAKKKYVGIPHISIPNFNYDDPKFKLFIRGLALKTRGVSEVLINTCNNILMQMVNHNNILTIMEIVQNKILDFYKSDWTTPDKFEAFIMTDVYKPNKNNVKMRVFRNRMIQERGIEIPPGDRIKYVIAKKYPYKYDGRGCKSELSVGDKMELADKAQEECISIDIDYYMQKKINGQLARFITYHDDFQVPMVDPNDPVELEKAEKINLKLARKFVDNFAKQFFTHYQEKGGIYKNIFKRSAKIVKDKITEACGNNSASNMIIKLLGFSVDPDKDLAGWIIGKSSSIVEKKKSNINYGKNYVDNILKNKSKADQSAIIRSMQLMYYTSAKNIAKSAEDQYNERQQILELRFRISINNIIKLYHLNNQIIEDVSEHIKTIIDINTQYNEPVETPKDTPQKDIDEILASNGVDVDEFDKTLEDIAQENIKQKNKSLMSGINDLKFIYYNLISNYEYIFKIRSIVGHLKQLQNKKIGLASLTIADKNKIMAEYISASQIKIE